MYIRQTSRKNKDGSTVRYLQLAHNVWDAQAGCAKAQVIYNFGRADQVDVDALRRLVKSIFRFLSPEDDLRTQAELAGQDTDSLRFIESRPLGGAWVLAQLWERLGIPAAIQKALAERNFRSPVERALFAMVANRCLAPASKLAVEKWVREEVALPGCPDLPVQQLYRAMDALLEVQEPLQERVFFSVAHLLNLEVDLLFLDTTSTYFEVEEEDEKGQGLRRRGHSKDHRPDLPQAVIGLAVTREGIPVRCWVWPGNTADVSVISEVKRDLVGWKLGRVITVIDRGFTSEANLRELQRAGGHYIAGEKMQSGKAEVEEALSRAGRYKTVRDNIEVKEIVVGDGEARTRYILVRNPHEAVRDKAKREEILGRLQEELAAIGTLDGKAHSKAVCELVAHPVYGRYLKTDRKGRSRLNEAKIREEERLDGKYLLRTSDDTLSAEDAALGYRQLHEVEDAFRTLKQTLELRPVYHRLEDRIRAHVLLCWLGLLLIRVAETRTRRTWRDLRASLQRMHLGRFEGEQGVVEQRTETTADQGQIFQALGIEEPPRIYSMTTSLQEEGA